MYVCSRFRHGGADDRQAAGSNEKTRVTVLNRKKSGTMIIKVRGTRLAIGSRIAAEIQVEEAAS